MQFKKLFFFWAIGFGLATLVFYSMLALGYRPFGSWYRMIRYHVGHPIGFIAIVIFFYGFIANWFSGLFSKSSILRKIGLTVLIGLLTILASSPFGGMLWHYYDMQAGWYPKNWMHKLFVSGFQDGLGAGWLIILISMPYNLIGFIVSYFINEKGSQLL